MAIIKKSDIVKMKEPQLKERLIDLKKEMIKVNAQVAIGTVENPGRIKEIKRTIASINTILNTIQKSKNKEKVEDVKKEIKSNKEEKKKG